MSNKTLLTRMMPVLRNLNDLALKLNGKLWAYDNVTLYRYKIEETVYKDRKKTLIKTIRNVHIFIDFPGEVPLLNSKQPVDATANTIFIEDMLPIIALFPWKHNNLDLDVDVYDEFEFTLIDDKKRNILTRYEIYERKADFQEQELFRQFVVGPLRTEADDNTPSGDSNITPGEVTEKIYSEYDK